MCAFRAPFAGGVKAHCACWQQSLNSPVLAAQPSATDPPELQELPTALPMNLGTSPEKGGTKQTVSNYAGTCTLLLVHEVSDTLGARAWQGSQAKQ